MPDKKLTDGEIVKALKCCCADDNNHNDLIECEACPYVKNRDCTNDLRKDTFDLITRLQEKVKKFENRQKPTGASGYKIENGKVIFFTNMLGGYREEKENLEEVVKTLNELLQECYSKDEIAFALKCKTEELKTAKTEAYKEFAERLKEEIAEALKSNYKARLERTQSIPIFTEDEFVNYCSGKIDCLRGIDDFLNNLLKELVGEDDGEEEK